MQEQEVKEAPKFIIADIKSALPNHIIDLVRAKDGTYLAGGCFRSFYDKTIIADYDFFFRSEECAQFALKTFDESEIVFKCPAGKLTTVKRYGTKIQLITPRYYATPFDLIDTFDINAAKMVCWHNFMGTGLTYHANENAVDDAFNKRITLGQVTYPIATINRIHKYRAKGYSITDEVWKDLLTKVRQLSEEDFNDPDKMALYID